MTQDPIDDLRRRMSQAVADEDYELAARLRDQLAELGDTAPAGADGLPPTKIRRQVPGQMGLGIDQQVYKPPEGWSPPPKPDLMTTNRKAGGRRRS